VFVFSGLHGLGLMSQIDLVCTSSSIMLFQVSSTSSYHLLGGKCKKNTQGFALIIPDFLCVTMDLHRPNLKMYSFYGLYTSTYKYMRLGCLANDSFTAIPNMACWNKRFRLLDIPLVSTATISLCITRN